MAVADLIPKIPYKSAPREKVTRPKRQKPGGYRDPDYPFNFVKERY